MINRELSVCELRCLNMKYPNTLSIVISCDKDNDKVYDYVKGSKYGYIEIDSNVTRYFIVPIKENESIKYIENVKSLLNDISISRLTYRLSSYLSMISDNDNVYVKDMLIE